MNRKTLFIAASFSIFTLVAGCGGIGDAEKAKDNDLKKAIVSGIMGDANHLGSYSWGFDGNGLGEEWTYDAGNVITSHPSVVFGKAFLRITKATFTV